MVSRQLDVGRSKNMPVSSPSEAVERQHAVHKGELDLIWFDLVGIDTTFLYRDNRYRLAGI